MLKKTLRQLNRLIKSNRKTAILSLLFYLLVLFHPVVFHHEHSTFQQPHVSGSVPVEILVQQDDNTSDTSCFVCSTLGNLTGSDTEELLIAIVLEPHTSLLLLTPSLRQSKFYLPITSRGPPSYHRA